MNNTLTSFEKFLLGFLGIIIAIALALLIIYTHYARENFAYALKGTPQDATAFLNKKTADVSLVTPQDLERNKNNYLQHYFSPWSPDYLQYFPELATPIHSLQELKTIEQTKADQFQEKPGFGINHLPNSKDWVKEVAGSMDLAHFPNANQKVITLTNASLRELPTTQPSFGNWHEAGEGYPFDYLQTSTTTPNTPALVIQKSSNGAWSLIIINNTYGWVPSNTLAVVDDTFIKQWQTNHYVTLTKNNVALADEQGNIRFTADIGKIFPQLINPTEKNASDFFTTLIAVADADDHAVIKTARLSTKAATAWPIVPTPRNIAQMMNEMLNVKYGWGGMSGDCDCSFTTMDLFSSVGIWLPRNSSEQAAMGHGIDLNNLSNEKKQGIILKQGVPFLTLLHMPGHITVYIGQRNGKPYLFQTVWGVHTQIFGQEGRAILGDTVITPIDLGKHDFNVTETFLDRIDRMILLTDTSH